MLGVIILFVVFGLLALLVAFSRWLARRHWAAAGHLLIAVVLLACAHWLWPPVLHLQSYQKMRPVAAIAQVQSERTGPRAYRVTLTRLPAGEMQVFEMAAEEWRLDVRTLVWTGRAASLGLPPSFRLERLSGRFVRTESAAPAEAEATTGLPASFPLSDPDEAGEDIWAQARTGTRWQGQVDARHAYGPWRPLADGARFEVRLKRPAAGADAVLEAVPANEAATKAMR